MYSGDNRAIAQNILQRESHFKIYLNTSHGFWQSVVYFIDFVKCQEVLVIPGNIYRSRFVAQHRLKLTAI